MHNSGKSASALGSYFGRFLYAGIYCIVNNNIDMMKLQSPFLSFHSNSPYSLLGMGIFLDWALFEFSDILQNLSAIVKDFEISGVFPLTFERFEDFKGIY